MTQVQHEQRSRTPKNSVAGKPLPLRLSPEERTTIETMAKEECRSASNMARIVFLRGLEAMKAD
ncbi:hypothetical protein [Pluralibacter gergoviae]|uniref:hypothetical protein n=1 Tax=Pluralibacter gergoviae TaxID=61647 RepID=UPI0006AC5667|nr:hypothetical protein [Pluralibacter gergoviae]KOQ95157.1 hypothetical protein ABW48_18360 [Pluralibacter gergoviae]